MNTDGTGVTRITTDPDTDWYPNWSPDGTKLVFMRNTNGNADIYTMNADGSAQTNLTNNPAGDATPTWSPDGTKIAFSTSRDGGNSEIYTMNADGSAPTRLTTAPGTDIFPTWQSFQPTPDELIRASGAASFTGDGVYDPAGASQTVSITAKSAKQATFDVKVQNDSASVDTLTIQGCASSQAFTVTYLAGSTVITNAVVAGTYSTGSLTPRGERAISVQIKGSGKPGSSISCLITASSRADASKKDGVRAVVVLG
jgi:TolB protein